MWTPRTLLQLWLQGLSYLTLSLDRGPGKMGDRSLKPNGTRARGGTLSCCEYRRDSAATFTGSTFACGGLASAGPCPARSSSSSAASI